MPFEDKEGCPNIWRFHFWQNPFLDALKSRQFQGLRFWHFPTLIFLGKKGGIYEEKELQRSKGFKTSSCKV